MIPILKSISDFIMPYKLYLYAAVLAAAVGYHFFYGHEKYVQGKHDCIEQNATAQIEYERKQHEKEIQAAQEALVRQSEQSEHIQSLEKERDEAIKQAKANAIKANRPPVCNLSDDELRQFNEAIRKANGS